MRTIPMTPRIFLALSALLIWGLAGSSAHAQELSELRTTADVAELVAPSVVNVNTTRTVRQRSPFADDPFFRRFFGEPEGGREREATNLGSGVIISSDGYVITNNHVVAQADEVRISTIDGGDYLAEVVGTDEASDLALLKVDAEGLTALPIGDSDALRVGEVVLAIGNPFGLGGTVTMGIVSAKGRGIGLIDYEDFIQTDAAINPGNSGGALVNLRGELVGLNSAILSRSGGSQGVGFAIPSKLAMIVTDNLREYGHVVRGYLGVRLQDLDHTLARGMGLDDDERGVVVSFVEEGSPADEGGLEAGDVVLEMDGDEMDSMRELRTIVGHTRPGTKVKLKIFRQGDRRMIEVELGSRQEEEVVAQGEPEPEEESLTPFEGVSVQEASPRLNQYMRLPADTQGPVVVNVEARTPAARAGLQAGDIIRSVNRESIDDANELRNAVRRAVRDEPDRPVVLLVERGQVTIYLAVDPSGH